MHIGTSTSAQLLVVFAPAVSRGLRVHHGGIRHGSFPSCRLFDVSMSGRLCLIAVALSQGMLAVSVRRQCPCPG
jgi:hypothetical protein